MVTVSYGNGKSQQVFLTQLEAEEALEREYPDVEFGEWEQDDPFSDRQRMLVWASEDDAENDDGQNAVAEIVSYEGHHLSAH